MKKKLQNNLNFYLTMSNSAQIKIIYSYQNSLKNSFVNLIM